eukprot:CAMPEP_0206138104 /NCGR_PEP_ID=MMETSP1473-20131121/3074_1 /ASSEMBLY_ACC=CAM_ASM_001109 /TAXON_ID=1461547 /ORGANISM="Stichococcus sp, Strain RCC1054" /LENGTH=293 /DNA_ID=CAMNT_0053531433 /DNA_START=347 /DNA_END=1229 /DNA_ORIENTATION=+
MAAGIPAVQKAEALWGAHADIGLALALALALPLMRALLDLLVFKPLGRWAVCKNRRSPTKKESGTIYKYKESCWKACMNATMAVLAYSATELSWLRNTRGFWEGCTRLPCDFAVSNAVRIVYIVEMGFYIQAIPYLVFWETRRKDFLESFAHHVATLVLIVYSYWLNLTKVGVVVFWLHDVNDIFMELAKIGRYAGRDLLPNALFVVFLLSWIATRLVMFPGCVIRSVLYDAAAVAKENGITMHPHYEIFSGFLIFLLCLHIYWTWLIMKVLWKVLGGGSADDVREEDDEKED